MKNSTGISQLLAMSLCLALLLISSTTTSSFKISQPPNTPVAPNAVAVQPIAAPAQPAPAASQPQQPAVGQLDDPSQANDMITNLKNAMEKILAKKVEASQQQQQQAQPRQLNMDDESPEQKKPNTVVVINKNVYSPKVVKRLLHWLSNKVSADSLIPIRSCTNCFRRTRMKELRMSSS